MKAPASVPASIKWRLEFAGDIGSTNEFVLERAREGEEEGLAVWARYQRKGRGRMGRTWHSPPGCGLYFSALLRPPVPPEEKSLMSILAGVAAAECLSEIGGRAIGLKWPNDLRLGRKKVGGILCEYEPRGGEIGAVAVGIGINLKTPADGYPEGILATSMEEAGCRLGGGEEMIGALLDRLGRCYRNFLGQGFEPIRKRWEGLCDGIGEIAEVSLAGESVSGRARGIDEKGRLVLEQPGGGTCAIEAGEVIER